MSRSATPMLRRLILLTIMRGLAAAAVIAAAMDLSAAQLLAAPAGAAGWRTVPSFPPTVQVGGDHGAACSPGYHYACWYEPYGHRYCGCWPGGDVPACPIGFRFSCRYDPYGRPVCACY